MIRILLAEDMAILRESLTKIFSFTSDIKVAATCERGDDVIPRALECEPDVAVLDVRLPGISGFDAARRLRRVLPRCRTLFITSYATAANLRQATGVGALGFLSKDASPDQLANAIRRVHTGHRVFDPGILADALSSAVSPLTTRETEILCLAAAGEPPDSIARKLSLAVGTVRNQLRSCAAKLNARNRVDALRIATEHGWI